MRTPVLLAILDGVGIAPPSKTNAVTSANAPFLHDLFSGRRHPFRLLKASGRDVGLPDGQMGNSEVGHLNIGAGRIVNQELTRIDAAIADGSLLDNAVLRDAFEAACEAGSTVHFMGLLSDGGVHSSLSHLQALLGMAANMGCKRIRVHAFLDGRDVSPVSGADYIEALDGFMTGLVYEHMGLNLRIGSLHGRYFAMDRDRRWERVERSWRTLVVPYEPDVNDVFSEEDPASLIKASYKEGVTDEFLEPVSIGTHHIVDGDTVVFFNFRPDRARELTRAFIDPDFESYGFRRPERPELRFVCMTEYDPDFAEKFGALVAFPKAFPNNTLAMHLAALGLRQFHIAETEKYAHVTFFFNGGIEEPVAGERRVLVPSPKVATYDLQPQMSAFEVTEALVSAIAANEADAYIVNYANGDMVGHTGYLDAATAAIEAVDACLGRAVDAIVAAGGIALVTADHGNSEQMADANGDPWTAHTANDVPLALIDGADADKGGALRSGEGALRPGEDALRPGEGAPLPGEGGASTPSQGAALRLDQDGEARLADIAPTLLDIMGIPAPPEFTGRSLLLRDS
jgi:2,3-bisphosphoglycerate-independent phosphoglycerate mutase